MWDAIVSLIEKVAVALLAFLAGREKERNEQIAETAETSAKAKAIREASAGSERDALLKRLRVKDN